MGLHFNMNEKYFETPTIENCYYAGLLASDGCIHDKIAKGGRQKRLCINLKIEDSYLLENLHSVLKPENKLLFSIKRNTCTLQCSSNQICKDLENFWNIVPRKSLILKPPNIKDSNFIKSFIVGYIDGNGSIFKRNNKICLKIVSGSKELIEWCQDFLCKLISKDKNKIHFSDCHYIVFYGKDAESILNILKKTQVPKMIRKWNKV